MRASARQTPRIADLPGPHQRSECHYEREEANSEAFWELLPCCRPDIRLANRSEFRETSPRCELRSKLPCKINLTDWWLTPSLGASQTACGSSTVGTPSNKRHTMGTSKDYEILSKLAEPNSVNAQDDHFSPQRRMTIESFAEEMTKRETDTRHFWLTLWAFAFSFALVLIAWGMDSTIPNSNVFTSVLPVAASIASAAVGNYLGKGSSMKKLSDSRASKQE